jgi:hypothetical protein
MTIHLIRLIETYLIGLRAQVIESINQQDGYQILIKNQDGVAILWAVIEEACFRNRITEIEHLEYASLLAYKGVFLKKKTKKIFLKNYKNENLELVDESVNFFLGESETAEIIACRQ